MTDKTNPTVLGWIWRAVMIVVAIWLIFWMLGLSGINFS
jgi:hypothetical protein